MNIKKYKKDLPIIIMVFIIVILISFIIIVTADTIIFVNNNRIEDSESATYPNKELTTENQEDFQLWIVNLVETTKDLETIEYKLYESIEGYSGYENLEMLDIVIGDIVSYSFSNHKEKININDERGLTHNLQAQHTFQYCKSQYLSEDIVIKFYTKKLYSRFIIIEGTKEDSK